MGTAVFAKHLERAWQASPPLCLGPPPSPANVPHVLVTDPVRLRIDLYAEDEYFFREELLFWHNWLVIACGHRVHLVDLPARVRGETRATISHDLHSYFGYLYPCEVLLVASADRLRAIDRHGELLWTSPPLGVDGVVVSEVKNGHILGEGEWDPPGGWRPFRLELASGR